MALAVGFERFINGFSAERLLVFAVAVGVILCALGAVIGKEFFLTAAVAFGTAWLTVCSFYRGFDDVEKAMLFSAYLVATATFYGGIIVCETAKKRRAEKRARRKKRERDVYYTLPDKENEFLKERLRSDLSSGAIARTGKRTDIRGVKTGYVNALMSRLKKAPLSAADRLETERLFQLIELYAKKGELLADELRAFNDALSAVIKLSAKYVVDGEVNANG